MTKLQHYPSTLVVLLAAAVLFGVASTGLAATLHTSGTFSGVKVNGGTVMHSKQNGRHVLTLSDDFKVPDTPDPHWQIVDSRGKVHLLDRLAVKGDRVLRSITLPAYIKDIVRVQIWCSWAEANLGEASFDTPVK